MQAQLLIEMSHLASPLFTLLTESSGVIAGGTRACEIVAKQLLLALCTRSTDKNIIQEDLFSGLDVLECMNSESLIAFVPCMVNIRKAGMIDPGRIGEDAGSVTSRESVCFVNRYDPFVELGRQGHVLLCVRSLGFRYIYFHIITGYMERVTQLHKCSESAGFKLGDDLREILVSHFSIKSD